ncbi:MAG: hypothetical protein IH963_00760 [Chloroflexi bacterium]|nr:hypothetical protein [Chloroflexota bacterium]
MGDPDNSDKDKVGPGFRFGFLLVGGTTGGIVGGLAVAFIASIYCGFSESCGENYLNRTAFVIATLVGGIVGAFIDAIVGAITLHGCKGAIAGAFIGAIVGGLTGGLTELSLVVGGVMVIVGFILAGFVVGVALAFKRTFFGAAELML